MWWTIGWIFLEDIKKNKGECWCILREDTTWDVEIIINKDNLRTLSNNTCSIRRLPYIIMAPIDTKLSLLL